MLLRLVKGKINEEIINDNTPVVVNGISYDYFEIKRRCESLKQKFCRLIIVLTQKKNDFRLTKNSMENWIQI